MKNVILAILLLTAGIAVSGGCSAKYQDFGEPMRLADASPVPLDQVLADPQAYDGKTVRVAGKVDGVCEKKGCWLTMTDGKHGETVFVKFTCPIEGRLIPMEAVGKPVIVEGTIKAVEVPEAEARHMAEDGGATAEEIAKIVGPQKRLQIQAPAARVKGV